MRKVSNTMISVCDFGAVGDGVTDDTIAIQKALDTGARKVIIPPGIFIISNCIEPSANQEIEIIGTLKIANANIQPLTADVVAGQAEVTVADAGGFRAGQWVTICDDQCRIQTGGTGQTRKMGAACSRIVSIENNTLRLEGRFDTWTCSVAAHARLGTQPSAILIQNKSNVRIHGSGVIDGNKANQFDVLSFVMEGCELTNTGGRSRGIGLDSEEMRAGSGIVCAGQPGGVENIVIEDLTVRDAIHHNICLMGVVHSSIRNTTCTGAHDKNITMCDAHDCRIQGNYCLHSEFEDGIMFHQATGNYRIMVQGNVCIGNPRYGIQVGAQEEDIHLSGNLCRDNSCNICLWGSNCSSTGDISIGESNNPLALKKRRPRVWLAGRNIQVSNLTATGSRLHNVRVTAQDLMWTSGLVQGTGDDRENMGLIFNVPADLTRSEILTDALRVQIQGVRIANCETGVKIDDAAREIVFRNNWFHDNQRDVDCDKTAAPHIAFSGNHGVDDKTGGKGQRHIGTKSKSF